MAGGPVTEMVLFEERKPVEIVDSSHIARIHSGTGVELAVDGRVREGMLDLVHELLRLDLRQLRRRQRLRPLGSTSFPIPPLRRPLRDTSPDAERGIAEMNSMLRGLLYRA